MNSRLAIGTVQFGQAYGVANQIGQVGRDDAIAILERAWTSGIDTLDTAIVYGESEQRLGEICVESWRVISKLPVKPEKCNDVVEWVQESVLGSLDRLRIPKLYGLLLHSSQQLLGSHGKVIYKSLLNLKEQNKIEKIGISIYDPVELDVLWKDFNFDIVQAPFNIMDRRLDISGWLRRMHQTGTEVHVRSIFLQGLLLMDQTKRPPTFSRWQPLWDQWHHWLVDQSLSPVQGCLGFALSYPEINRIVVGVDSLQQLQEILVSVDSPFVIAPATLMCNDLDLINPSHWRKS